MRVKPAMEVDQTLYKSLTVLETVARSSEPCGVTELAERLGLTKSNTHRILRGLVTLGYLRPSEERGRYELTSKLWELGSHFFSKLDIRRICAPYMTQIAEATQETILLSVLEGAEVLFLGLIESPQTVRAYTAVGERAAAQYVASGRVQLAWADEATVALARSTLRPHTPRSIMDPAAFEAELAQIRRQGYATCEGEWVENANSIAVPVRDASGRIVAGIGVAGPADRLDKTTCIRHSPLLLRISREISDLLGYRGD